jgi:hypothetical protein
MNHSAALPPGRLAPGGTFWLRQAQRYDVSAANGAADDKTVARGRSHARDCLRGRRGCGMWFGFAPGLPPRSRPAPRRLPRRD